MNILSIGAHPDDLEIGCFGTLSHYKSIGYSLYNLVISLGEDAGDPARRKKESEQAAKLLGAEVKFGNLPSAYLSNNSGRETIDLIEKAIRCVEPNIIFTHSAHDRHQDHRLVNLATESACRFFKGDIFYYEGFSSLKTFNPTLFHNIDLFFEDKLKALSLFGTQSKKPYMDKKAVETLSRFRAYQANIFGGLAEAFEIGRMTV
jgi:LmbE family N-acetylglucosaminyl deacetylase